ncbi:hypothetical protein I4U23_021882 [Adineta vaga]|nr:hypothetical protein I4U23_021882 [Adineta vaga]
MVGSKFSHPFPSGCKPQDLYKVVAEKLYPNFKDDVQPGCENRIVFPFKLLIAGKTIPFNDSTIEDKNCFEEMKKQMNPRTVILVGEKLSGGSDRELFGMDALTAKFFTEFKSELNKLPTSSGVQLFNNMNSPIVAFVLFGILFINSINARRINVDDSDERRFETLFTKRGATYGVIETSSRCVSIISGKDYNGGDIDINHPVQLRSAAACAGLCDSVPDCFRWSFDTTNGKCFLKDTAARYIDNSKTYTGECTKST